MNVEQHPITPPPELVGQWLNEWYDLPAPRPTSSNMWMATQAARWGYEQGPSLSVTWLECELQKARDVAAALRAAADQVVPEECLARFPNDSAWQDGFTDANERIRAELLAIAAELDPQSLAPESND